MSKGNIARLVSVLLLALGEQSSAMAEGIRLKAGVAMLTFTDTSSSGQPDFVISGQALLLGASYVFKDTGIFVDFTNRSTGSTKWNTSEYTAGALPDQPAKYTDNTFTVGKMLGDGLIAFGGYQSQETTSEVNDPAVGYIYNDKLTVSGFFAGASKAISLGQGWLSATGALAMMGSKASWSDNTPSSGGRSKDPDLGYSLGLAYSYPINEMFDVIGEGKHQYYKPKGSGANTTTTFGLNVVAKF